MAVAVNKILEKLPVTVDSLHCVGIGGIGVSAIAELLLEGGFRISGSDQEYNENCVRLAELGADIAPAGHRLDNRIGFDIGVEVCTHGNRSNAAVIRGNTGTTSHDDCNKRGTKKN